MFKKIHHKIWVFDAEWVPDPSTGRRVYHLEQSASDQEVINEMWQNGGATEENPMPYLKTVLCRIVSISVVTRTDKNGHISLRLHSLPSNSSDSTQCQESQIISKFLNATGDHKPQLIGYNSYSSDLKILTQRAIANGIQASDFCRRPIKPWEGVDYFARGNDSHIDLREIISGWGKSTPSLHEIATASGIPGKMDVDGQQVATLWLEGKLDEIIHYNEFDTLTTYLLWLRMAHFGGFFSDERYQEEQERVKVLLREEGAKPESRHLIQYLDTWETLSGVSGGN